MSYAKLRGRIREVFGGQDAFAKALGMNPATLSKKLNGNSAWTVPEIESSCKSLSIPLNEVSEYFFSRKSC